MEHKNNLLYHGRKPVLEALEANVFFDKIFIQNDMRGDFEKSIRRICKEKSIPLKKVPLIKLDQMTRTNHQGVIAFGSPIPFYALEDVMEVVYERGEAPLILILDRITDVRNFGAIARSALAFGVHGIVIPVNHSAEVNHIAVKASAGALWSLKVCRMPNLEDTIRELKSMGLSILGADSNRAEKSLDEMDLSVPTAIVMGSEGLGIRRELLQMLDERFAIQHTSTIDSLNVAVAAGIVLHKVYSMRAQSKR